MRTFLIDDDNLGNYLTESLLRVEGFSSSVQTFESAENALEVLQQRPAELPEVIFLDLKMPVMNGWQFLDALAPYADVLRDHCHIYILTSSLALSDLEKAKTYELVTRLIHKPIDVEELRTIRAQLKNNG